MFHVHIKSFLNEILLYYVREFVSICVPVLIKFEFGATIFELKRLYEDISYFDINLKAGLHHQNFCDHSRYFAAKVNSKF